MSARRLWGHPSEQFAIRVVFSLHSSHQFVEVRHVSDTSRKGKAKSLSPSPCYLPLLWVGKPDDFPDCPRPCSETSVVWKRNSKLPLTHHEQAFFRAIDFQERIRLPPARHNDRADAVSCTCSNVSLMTLPLRQPHLQTGFDHCIGHLWPLSMTSDSSNASCLWC